MIPSEADPVGSASEWLRQRPEWSHDVKDGHATLSRTYSFSDESEMDVFLPRLTELVTSDQGHDLSREDGELTTRVTLIDDKPELERTFLRHAEECDSLYRERCESDEDDLFVEDPSDSAGGIDDDDDWD
ncbi:MAG: hypothetical protein HY566_02845 [Candidatus Kerfeldbacteria bacterium]|nr:hypothetical protein [Candidatus Kerfeldbacteria bacterium]